MDISKLRKKHKESKEKPESEKAEERSEESEVQEEPEEELKEELEELAEDIEEDLEAEAEAEERAEEKVRAAAAEKREAVPPVTTPPKPSGSTTDEEPEKVDSDELIELVTFTLASEYYAFRVTEVDEVLRPQYVAMVPRSANFIVGVTSLRGKIIPVMDLRKRINVAGEAGEASNIVILKGVGKGVIGVLVDRTQDVIKVPPGDIKLPPSHLVDSEARFLEGVTTQDDKFISIISLDELLEFNAYAEEL